MTVEELAARWRCSERFIRDEIARGTLPARRIGRRLVVDQADATTYEQARATVTATTRRARRPRARTATP